MRHTSTRREFMKTMLAGTAGLSLVPECLATTSKEDSFAFPFLGDLHYDQLNCHDLEKLGREKPDDLRQVHEYSSLTTKNLPRLFASVRESILELNRDSQTTVPFTIQAGDFVEGLCGSADQSRQLDLDAIKFARESRLGVPFFFTKGNHDITGPGATDAFKSVFHPFLGEQAAAFGETGKLAAARYKLEHRNALFLFFDAYDKESLSWLEAELSRRTARHCFLIVHPPVVPYGARATWHLFSGERERSSRDRLLELLGRNHAIVLSGHIHKYNVLARDVPRAGRFLQVAISSVITTPDPQPGNVLSGLKDYTEDQVKVEPNFSPATEPQRRAVYRAEAPMVKDFQYADLPGYVVVRMNGPKITAAVYPGVGRNPWRVLSLSDMLLAS